MVQIWLVAYSLHLFNWPSSVCIPLSLQCASIIIKAIHNSYFFQDLFKYFYELVPEDSNISSLLPYIIVPS